jgi:uncharacterized RDD family membrane protein YckC
LIAGSFRRLAAAIYDGLLLLGLLMITTAALQGFTGGEAITYRSVGAWEYVYRAAMVALVVAYYGVAWTRRGQTLGMKAWKLRTQRADGTKLRWADVFRRLGCAAPLYLLAIVGVLAFMTKVAGPAALVAGALPLAASYAWLTLRGTGTLHDAWSRTSVVHVPAKSPGPRPIDQR